MNYTHFKQFRTFASRRLHPFLVPLVYILSFTSKVSYMDLLPPCDAMHCPLLLSRTIKFIVDNTVNPFFAWAVPARLVRHLGKRRVKGGPIITGQSV